MHARTLALSLAPLFAVSLAHAQAADELAPEPPDAADDAADDAPAAPVMAPAMVPVMAPAMVPVAAPVACVTERRPRASVMANRWAVGLSVGSMSLAPDGAPDDKTTFAIGELALRFRVTPHLELELTAGGGRERTADDQDGDLAVGAVALAARYRFRPEAAWNWFVMGGVGAASVTRHDATDQQRHDATQPLGMLGLGIERRFRHFAVQAEARAVGLANRRDDRQVVDRAATTDAMSTTVTPAPTQADQARGGGSLSVGLSYYF